MNESKEIPDKVEIKIIDFMKEFIDDEDIITFKLAFDGQVYSANKTHSSARGMIMFPKEICKDNLKDLDKWVMCVIAIPKEKAKNYMRKKLEEINH